jgi:hypothetical protein
MRTSPSDQFNQGSWSDVTNFTYTNPIVITDPASLTAPKRFYRVVTP